ncbi:MAG TPA: hypothetical protein PLZ57_08090 [Pseudobdellovibrionaceae bacterium]|nr:hypothetical protein [Pseudobdellovibrionaceae bacterium]
MRLNAVWSKLFVVMGTFFAFELGAFELGAIELAGACEQPEAQFRGRVKSLEIAADGECRMRLTLNFQWGDDFVSSQICPLDLDEALARSIRVAKCEGLRVGDAVSGYLIWPRDSEDLQLE